VESKRQQKGPAVNNTIEIFGLVLEPVHFNALAAVTVIGTAARALWHLRAIRQEAKGKAFDRFMAHEHSSLKTVTRSRSRFGTLSSRAGSKTMFEALSFARIWFDVRPTAQ
jgi:ornithine cyclodeaminase/alanine dehydrogenase-like protein (mu-crystallin family)